VIVILCAFLKFFIFGDSGDKNGPEEDTRSFSRVTPLPSFLILSLISQLRKKRSSVLRAPPPLTTSSILSKTGYNPSSHPRESLDWFNVLIAQMIAQFRDDARMNNAIVSSLDEVFNSDRKPGFLGEIKITELALGEEFPRFSNCRILPFLGDPNRLVSLYLGRD
jgi:maintenance of mitochondrial morphology protein 1